MAEGTFDRAYPPGGFDTEVAAGGWFDVMLGHEASIFVPPAVAGPDPGPTGVRLYDPPTLVVTTPVGVVVVDLSLTGPDVVVSNLLSAPGSLGVLVVDSRQIVNALVPRSGGGWDWIAQSYEYPNDVPTEWVVLNLETGAFTIDVRPNLIFGNGNYRYPLSNVVTDVNQVRAANGRVFFGETLGNGIGTPVDQEYVNVAYFDPVTRHVIQMPAIHDPTGDWHQIVFRMEFNHTGDKIYCGTQSGDQPMIFTVDPVTLVTTYVANVGVVPSINPRYAYYLAVDEGAPYVYVAVGQDPWELVALNYQTGVQTVLATMTGASQFISFTIRPKGWSVGLKDNGVTTLYWLGDGALFPYVANDPPFTDRDCSPYVNLLVEPPEIDWTPGIGLLLWRPHGSTGSWNESVYDVQYKESIDLESVTCLKDRTMLINSRNYHGYVRHDPAGPTSVWYGNWPGVSGPSNVVTGDGSVYVSGYPDGVLWKYDPTQQWDTGVNPAALGNFAASDITHVYFMTECLTNSRLYMAGQRERNGVGSGVGWYHPGSAVYGGHFTGMGNVNPAGLVVLEEISRVVMNGKRLASDPGPGEMFVFDFDLVQVAHWTMAADIANLGLCFTTSDPQVVCCMSIEDNEAFRVDVTTGTILSRSTLGGQLGAVCRRPVDDSVWMVIAGDLWRMEPDTLVLEFMKDLGAVVPDLMAWHPDGLYVTDGPTLYVLDTL